MTTNDMPGLRDTQEGFSQVLAPTSRALELDPADYLSDMEDFDLSASQKVELLGTLWGIMRRFVEMGVDVGRADVCGEIFGALDELAATAPDGVKSSFSKATEMQTDKEEKPG